MKDVCLPPYAPVLIESTRAIGYSLESAIADIIDNSLSAGAKNVKLHYLPQPVSFIAILDDGEGMSDAKLKEAMRYGSVDPLLARDATDMGRYGLGMKTASLSQCRCLTVASIQQGVICAYRWDLDYIKHTGEWSLLILDEDDIKSLPMMEQLGKLDSGTLVVWQSLDKIFSGEIDIEQAMTEKMSLVEKHLSLVFHRFLQGGDADKKVALSMNEAVVSGFDPFFTAKSRQPMDEERIEIPQYSSVVTVTPFILPHPSKMTRNEIEKYGGADGMRGQQGFYIYRNKRLLIWGTWFRMTKMDEFSKLARVRIDIPNTLDDLWALDVKKSTAVPPEIVKSRLKQIINHIVDNSRKTYTFRGRRETRDGVAHIWNVIDTREGVRYELNSDHHRSMLVNINPYTYPQECTYDLIDIYVDRLQKEIKAYSKLSISSAMKNSSIATLRDLWNEENLTNKCGKTFEDVLPHLTESTLPIKVTMVNTKTKSRGLERLDYKPYEANGHRVIVVGGNSLSRGITLEGLCVSYFFRESKMYDTLLQMGRWFGYRPGYQDVFKVWMSERTIEWFSFINKACDELRSEIAYMNKMGQTPTEFGLRVLQHPDTLMITASNKMRSAKPMERWISLSGKLVETPWLSKKTINHNLKLTETFLAQLMESGTLRDNNFYEDVPGELVAQYVYDFASHPGHLVFNAREIGEYIRNNSISLGTWFVYIANGSEKDTVTLGGCSVSRTYRKMLLDGDCIRVSGNKSRVGSVGTTKITLSNDDQVAAYTAYREYLERQGELSPDSKITVPDHVYLRYAKHPLLIIYPMLCNPKQAEDTDKKKASPEGKASFDALQGETVVGIGLGFPRTAEEAVLACYKINLVEQRNNMPFALDDSLDGDEDDEN